MTSNTKINTNKVRKGKFLVEGERKEGKEGHKEIYKSFIDGEWILSNKN